MTEHDRRAADTATETHREPHGAASPHGAADDVPERAAEPAADHADHAEHGDGEELGPVDVPAWTAGALGIALGLVVVACLVAATGSFGA